MTTNAELHEAGEFHDPAGCLACYRVSAAENARQLAAGARFTFGFDGARSTGPTVVAFTANDGTVYTTEAESVTANYSREPPLPPELWDACVEPDLAPQALPDWRTNPA